MFLKPVRVMYRSTIRGATQSELNAEDIVYIGILIRIPQEKIPQIAEIEEEIDHQELLNNVKIDGFIYEYVPDGILERIDVRERGTGDLLGFWRIPFRKKPEEE